MRKAEEKNMQVFLCPPLSSSICLRLLHRAPWRRRPEARDENDDHSQGQCLQDARSFVQMRWSIHRRGEPDPDLTYPAIPHHWFRMRVEWQEEGFCAMIKLLLPFYLSVLRISLCLQEPVVSRDDMVHPRINQPQRESSSTTNHPHQT